MARYFYLFSIFHNEIDANQGVSFFDRLEISLTSGWNIRCRTGLIKTRSQLYCVFAEPEGVSFAPKTGIFITDQTQLDEIANQLYESLKELNGFSCAIAGWEVAELFLPSATSGYEDIEIDVEQFGIDEKYLKGLVISTDLWQVIDHNNSYLPFCEGYVWRPYQTLSLSGW